VAIVSRIRPLGLAGSALPPSKEPREEKQVFLSTGPWRGRCRGTRQRGSENGDQWMAVHALSYTAKDGLCVESMLKGGGVKRGPAGDMSAATRCL
jgi:hypothetical protein